MILAGGNAVFDGAGQAVVIVRPGYAGRSWHLKRISVSSSSTAMPKAFIYRNEISPSNFVEGTFTGGNDITEYVTPLEVSSNEQLVVLWTDGDPGATVFATFEGESVQIGV